MTDQEKFEAWWATDVHGWGTDDYGAERKLAQESFLAALAIGREEGRKERTVEIARLLCGDFTNEERWTVRADTYIEQKYPECFEKGEG